MSYSESYLRSAIAIVENYDGSEPFAGYLKKYFSANKKFGSRDRKLISQLCYCAFRIGNAATGISTEQRIRAGLFLCSTTDTHPLMDLIPEWAEQILFPVEEKAIIAGIDLDRLFPWKDDLSEGVERLAFSQSFLVQPDLFIRVRPGYHQKVNDKIRLSGAVYEWTGVNSLRLPINFKVDEQFAIDKEVVIQDLNSQRVGELMLDKDLVSGSAWDCCAASGGKSLMAFDINPEIEMTVSDIRESILINLDKRFRTAGIRKYRKFVSDLSGDNLELPVSTLFDLIIADVPCTGSGTWSRTPEHLAFFQLDRLAYYAALQEKIVANTVRQLKPGGYLLYITCSVFKEENETQIESIKEKFHLRVRKMELLKGYSLKADTMFAALLQKDL